jgi:hypothetical protein
MPEAAIVGMLTALEMAADNPPACRQPGRSEGKIIFKERERLCGYGPAVAARVGAAFSMSP